MPELPEIETTRKSLSEIVGRRMEQFYFSKLAPVETTTPNQIRRALSGTEITALKRWGKYLLVKNREHHGLVIHLGMSGQLRVFHDDSASPGKHLHMKIHLSGGWCLQFKDARRFGTLSLTQKSDGSDNPFLARLGPSYDDPQLTPEIFLQRCRRHGGLSLKSLTLNQGVASGLGNIYACEALYRARLDPRRRVRDTRDGQLLNLLQGAREALALGIKHGGVSMRDYLDGKGARGVMKEFLQVYGREGKSALDGSGPVQRIVQNARSTWFVPKVQK